MAIQRYRGIVLPACLRRLELPGTVLFLWFALAGGVHASLPAGEVSHAHSAEGFCLFADRGAGPRAELGVVAAIEASNTVAPAFGGAGNPAYALARQSGTSEGIAAPPPYYPWQDAPAGIAPMRLRLASDIRDLVVLPASMDSRQWRLVGGAILAVGAVSLLDEGVHDLVYTGSSGSQELGKLVRPIGQEGGLAVLGASWLLGRTLNRPKLSAIATDGLEATILSAGLVTPILKQLTGRARPRAGQGASSFSGGESFPSGEVTQAFAIASVVAAHAERKWVRGLAWSLAGLTAWQRMALDAHWGSDVLVGAVVGATLGRWVVRRNRPGLGERNRGSWVPRIGGGTYGLAFSLELGADPAAR